jgi:glycosyltransferase involved in cell wall biosynthesis
MKLGIAYHMPFWRGDDGTLREVEGSFARYVDSLAPYFDEVVVCAPVMKTGQGAGTPVRAGNVRLAPLPYFAGPVQFYPQLPAMIGPMVRFVREIDLLHCRIPTPAAFFLDLIARWMRRPMFSLVVTDLEALRSSMPYTGLKRQVWHAYTIWEERTVQRMADRSLTFANGSALAAKHSRPNHPVIETRTTTIDREDIVEHDDLRPGQRVRLLTVCRLDPRKGLRILPEVVQSLVECGHDATIDLIGPSIGALGDAERSAIEADAAARGVAGRVRFLGAVPLDELLRRYRDYDLFVLPTLPGEGIPRVLLEAMANGLPLVTSRVSGIPSLVEHEINGLLVDSPSASSVASALRRLVEDGPLRRRLRANGYETARSLTLQGQAARMMAIVSRDLGVTLLTAAALVLAVAHVPLRMA